MPTYIYQSLTPPCQFAVVLYAMDGCWTSRMCYLPFDGGHSRKAKCQARHLGRPKPECAGKSSWLWRGMRLRSLAWPYRPWQAKIVHERPWPPVAGHGRSCFRFEIVAMTIPKSNCFRFEIVAMTIPKSNCLRFEIVAMTIPKSNCFRFEVVAMTIPKSNPFALKSSR